MPSGAGLNDLFWAFGQFLDHDITLTHDSDAESFAITVPRGDAMFDPDSTGAAYIPMMRSAAYAADRGDSTRRYGNAITAFIDGSAVYGSDAARAQWLRASRGGRLKTSAGGLPPFNTLDGAYGSPVDAEAPPMAGRRSPSQRVLVCGDERANENSLLAAMHTVWLREHNWLADSLSAADPTLTDEALYQAARRLLIAELQQVVYEEWLPLLGIDARDIDGAYDPRVDPGISNEFAAAAFRFGHTLVGSELVLADERGIPLANSPLSLREVFFDPVSVVQRDGVAALLRGAASHAQQTLDARVVDDLRSFLFGRPGQGGLDLAAINVARGRERGLASFNDVRRDLGLSPVRDFLELTGDRAEAARLELVYGGEPELLDLWVGLMAEDKRGAMAGETLRALLAEQFARLRRGDRLFAAHAGQLSAAERAWVERQHLSRIVARSSGVGLPEEAFRVGVLSGAAFAKTESDRAIRAGFAGADLRLWDVPAHTECVTLYDLGGRLVSAWSTGVAGVGEGGRGTVVLPVRSVLPEGVYICEAAGPGGRVATRVIR